MPECTICGEKIPERSRTCPICGSSADEYLPTAPWLNQAPAVAAPMEVPIGGSYCPACAQVFGPDHLDAFCTCGTELCKGLPTDVPMAPILDDLPPMAPFVDESGLAESKPEVVKPPSGTPCLVLYGPDKTPLQYFALTKDATLIGRLDAVAGNFPDIDLDEWFDRATIRKISRQHAVILRTRATGGFVLRPLVGNTGTQLETGMVAPGQDYPLHHGHRIVLGGVIRLKFEIA